MARVATFHLISEPAWKSPVALARLGTDRLRLPRIEGLVFWRLLGTGRGDDTARGADLRRTALFAVWENEHVLDRFLRDHALSRRWDAAAEAWHVRLRLLQGHGRWRGIDPLDGLELGDGDGAIAVITRADVRRRSWRAFGASSRVVDRELHTAPGLIDVVGIGEAPIGRLATFSLWESIDAMRAFAATMPHHLDVVRRTRHEGWYAEELFARFEPYAAEGLWNGRNPLGAQS